MPIPITVKGRSAYIDPLRVDTTAAEILRAIPNVLINAIGHFQYPFTLIFVRRLVKAFGVESLNPSGDLPAWRAMVEAVERMPLAWMAREADELADPPLQRMPAWGHQKRGFWFGYHLPVALLSEKVGAGKTKQFFDIVCNKDSRKVLVVTTASAVDDWELHGAKHSTKPYHILALGQRWKAKNATAKAKAIEEAFARYEYFMPVLSHDSCWRSPLGTAIGNRRGGAVGDIGILAQLGFDTILVDEIHKLADPTGRLSLFLWRLGERIPNRYGMTGTIIRHKPEQCFAAYRFLDSSLFGARYDTFTDRYCIFNRPSNGQIEQAKRDAAAGKPLPPGMENIDLNEKDYGPRFIVANRNLDELGKLMSAITYHVDDCNLDLPEAMTQPRRCHLRPAGRRIYDELEETCAVELEDGTTILTPQKLTHLLRLAQAAGGAIGERIIDKDTGELDFIKVHEIDDAKEAMLEETFNEIDDAEPIVVACRFRHELDVIARVAKRCGRRCFEQSGRRKQRLDWQAANGGEVLAGQIASVCEAIDLTRAHYLIPYSVGYSLFQYDQLIGRIDRPGQKRHPIIIPLIAADTIDEAVYKAIEKHRDVAETIYEYLRAMQNRRKCA